MQLQRPATAVHGRTRRCAPSLLKARQLTAYRTNNVSQAAFKDVPARRGTAARAAEVTTAPTTSVDAPAAQPSESAAGAEQFDYARQWYPVGILEDLDPKVPTPVTLLGKDLVVWRDAQGAWRCFEDLCPHRLAALSEGRIEKDGTLQCAYHGWRFDGSGRCTEIPQITEPTAIATATSSKRSCARTYPTQEKQGLLWVWASSGPTAGLEAAASAPVLLPQLEASDGEVTKEVDYYFRWYTRELPYSYDILVENVADPSHVPFAHHGVQGNRSKPTLFTASLLGEATKDKGFVMEMRLPGQDNVFGTCTFRPPSLLNYQFNRLGGTLSAYAIPTRPGYSRIIAGGVAANTAPLPLRIYGKLPKWLDHILQRNEVLDGDGVFLRLGEEQLRARGNKWAKSFYMPSEADTIVMAARKWLDKYAGGTGPCASTGPIDLPRISRRAALDRWEQHTKHCPSCKQAHKAFTQLQSVALAAAAACLVAAAANAKAGAGLAALLQPQTGLWFAGAASALLLRQFFKGIAQKFVFVDYVHSQR